MRSASPRQATTVPAASVAAVGLASKRTSTPDAKPRPTRRRASHLIEEALKVKRPGLRSGRQTALDGGNHLGHLDVEQAHPIAAAGAEMMTLAAVRLRHGHVFRAPRAVALRPRRPVDADQRR